MFRRRGNRPPPAQQERSKSRRVRKREREQIASEFLRTVGSIISRARSGQDRQELFEELQQAWDLRAPKNSPVAVAAAMNVLGILFDQASFSRQAQAMLQSLAERSIGINRRFNAEELVRIVSPFARIGIAPSGDFMRAWEIAINDRWQQFQADTWVLALSRIAELKEFVPESVLDGCFSRGLEIAPNLELRAKREALKAMSMFPERDKVFLA